MSVGSPQAYVLLYSWNNCLMKFFNILIRELFLSSIHKDL